jgi:hypothetical protein
MSSSSVSLTQSCAMISAEMLVDHRRQTIVNNESCFVHERIEKLSLSGTPC